MDQLSLKVNYEWDPFLVYGKHLTFLEHCGTRLNKSCCSHWGAAVYKWEGLISEGENQGKTGILVGETSDVRQRIKQYVSGTQSSGNKYWREQFLTRSEARLYVMKLLRANRDSAPEQITLSDIDVLQLTNLRLALESLLVLRETLRNDGQRWLVNRKF